MSGSRYAPRRSASVIPTVAGEVTVGRAARQCATVAGATTSEGGLQPGDVMVSANDVHLGGMSHDEA